MDLDLLRTFFAVVRSGGMRRAANTLHVTQPAVSARIRLLEQELGVPLFERLGRGVRPTEAGRLLIDEGTHLLAAERALRERLDELLRLERGSLHLSTIDAASIYVLPEVYLEFRRAHPRVELHVQVTDSRRVLAAVRDLQVEIGVLVQPPDGRRDEDADIDFVPIFDERMVCVAAPSHPLAARASTTLAAVAAQPLVLYDRGSTTRGLLDAVFRGRQLTPHVVMETASPEAMKRLAEVGMGIAVLPEALVRDDVAAGRLRRLRVRGADFRRTLAVAVRRDRHLGLASRRFLECIHRRYPKRKKQRPRRSTATGS